MKKSRKFIFSLFFIALAVFGIVFGTMALVLNYMKQRNVLSRVDEHVVEKVFHSEKKVLLICSYDVSYVIVPHQISGVTEILSKNNIRTDIEFMDIKKYDKEEYIELYYNSLKYKLKNHERYDAVILADDPALAFARKYQDELFKGIPLFFFCTNDLVESEKISKDSMITGIPEKLFLTDTINLAIKLDSRIEKIAVIFDNSQTGIGNQKQILAEKENFPDKEFIMINTSNYSTAELAATLDRLNALDNTIVFFMNMTEDSSGKVYELADAIDFVLSFVKRAPIYTVTLGGLGKGLFGGKIFDFCGSGRLVAQMVIDFFNGRDISLMKTNYNASGAYYFDWQLMKRFGFNKDDFPEGTIFVNRTSHYWETHSEVFIPFLIISISLLVLVGVAWTGFVISRKKQILLDLRNSVIDEKNRILRENSEQLKFLSEMDYLTSIPNRFSVSSEIKRLIASRTPFSIMLMDIDDFKNVNDYYTHSCGDCILQDCAVRLAAISRTMDIFVSRYAGDEFLVVYKNKDSKYLMENSDDLKTIKLVMNQPFFYENIRLDVRLSCGVAHYEVGMSFDEIISNADIAMHEAKRLGKNKTVFYNTNMKDSVVERNKIYEILSEKIKNKGFVMLYQPQIDVESGEVHGYEALVRLEDSTLSPSKFIPLAEEGGYIASVGRIITEKVLSQMSEWRKNGFPLKKVAINYSNGQLADSDYVEYLSSLMKRYKIPADLIEIEITESLFLDNDNQAKKLFDSLSELGVKIALDDFGTGYSSLSYLTYLPVNKVKIDKSLVDNYLIEGKDKFIENIVHLVHDLGMELTVEGVEQEWQFDKLKNLNCDYIQGYYFSKPIPGNEVECFSPLNKH